MLKRRRWTVLVAVAVLVAAMPVAPATDALAQSGSDCIEVREVDTGRRDSNGNPIFRLEYVNVCDAAGGAGGGGGGGSRACQYEGTEVLCVHPTYGWWNSSYGCYVQLRSPQPPAGDPAWEGNDPAGGAIYTFYCPEDIGGQLAWSDREGFLSEAPSVPSAADLAAQAMRTLPLREADIGIAPNPEGVGLVGVHVWLWTNNTDATWGPVSISVSVPGLTVTARGEVARIEWDMGDRTTVPCISPGEPYQPEYGAREPECGHVYTYPSHNQPDGRYQITATTIWEVNWWVEPQGSAESGAETFDRTATTSVQINELQVVTS